MSKLNIFALDDIECKDLIASLHIGKHVLGRGDLLNVIDKRVSRNHALIEFTDETVKLTSIHQNPCFMRVLKSTTIIILKQNQEYELNDGDQFALLPDKYWFRIKIMKKNKVHNVDTNGKRHIENDLKRDFELSTKKIKVETDASFPTITQHHNEHCEVEASLSSNNAHENVVSNEMEIAKPLAEVIKCEPPDDISSKPQRTSQNNLNTGEIKKEPQCLREELLNTPEDANQTTSENNSFNAEEIKKEPVAFGEQLNTPEVAKPLETQASKDVENKQDVQLENTANQMNDVVNENVENANVADKKRRERCWYGGRCFRKNPMHKQTFSHPGDDDYQSDSDDLPDCPYGASCYQTNLAHRQQYKHEGKPAPKPSNIVILGCIFCDHCKANGIGTIQDNDCN